MSENCTIGDHSIAEIPMIGERGAPSLDTVLENSISSPIFA
jgi:hypothetical protein